MRPASEYHIPEGLLAANVLLSEKPRLGFQRTETTVHRASIRLNYLNGNRVSSTVVFEGRPVSLMAQQPSGSGILGKIKEAVGNVRDGIRVFREAQDTKLWIAAADADRKIIDNYDPITDRETVDLTLVQARLTFEIAKSAESLINLGMDFKSKASSFGTPDTVSGALGKIAIGVGNMGLNIAEAGYKASFDKSVKMAEQNYIQALEAHQ